MRRQHNLLLKALPIPFRRRSPWAAVVALALFATIFALRLEVHGLRDPITELYVLPIALLAQSFGLRMGTAAGATGVVLLATWVGIEGLELTPVEWATGIVPMLLLGVLLGDATDRLEQAAVAERALAVARVKEREAAEINDSILQGLAAAKWAVESGHINRGLHVLTDTVLKAESLVASLLHNEAEHPVESPLIVQKTEPAGLKEGWAEPNTAIP